MTRSVFGIGIRNFSITNNTICPEPNKSTFSLR